MSIGTITEQEPEEIFPAPTPFPEPWWGKLVYGLFIVVMPILAFWATELFKPEWQTGEFSAYLILLLFPQASLLFFVLLVYSIVCYCLLLIDPVHYSQIHFIRLGIYTGVLLALQYSVLSGLFFFNDSNTSLNGLYLVLLWLSPAFLPKLYRFPVKKWGAKAVNVTLFTIVIAIFLISALIVRSPLLPLFFVLAGLTVAAPFWCFLMTLRAAIWLLKKYEVKLTLSHGLGLAAWIAGYVAAWRFDILKMYELYAALPPQPPPDCYIATAAARGHPGLVGAWLIQSANGETVQVNKQLQVLKCAELALMAVNPRLHEWLRKLYDMLGRPLARNIQNPFVADLAYLLLIPWECMAGLLLKRIIPEIDSISKNMYRMH
jgi:uncharacterized protein DUF6688